MPSTIFNYALTFSKVTRFITLQTSGYYIIIHTTYSEEDCFISYYSSRIKFQQAKDSYSYLKGAGVGGARVSGVASGKGSEVTGR